ncbi:MAG: peptidoglycan editing factor PgeF [Hydrogenophilales bacterium]|nr:peptidoglycan editing factor PgeF [Hydrogenophilales bacterium]
MKRAQWIVPDWQAPPNVRALITTRAGGVSTGPYASMNPAGHVGDDPLAVAQNRALLRAALPSEPFWLKQVHGDIVAEAGSGPVEADACITRAAGQVCAVLTADCLPVLFCTVDGSVVGAAHAGWRGLCAGVLERTVAAMGVPGNQVLAYFGPAIGPRAFEVGPEVREAFMALDDSAVAAFAPQANGKYLADLYLLARQRLARAGVTQVHGGGDCTYSDAERFFSYRRDGATGRMAALVWIEPV